MIQTDGGGELKPLTTYLSFVGIKMRNSCPYTYEQKCIFEFKHVTSATLA